jgi:hypothetical protein
MLDFADVLGSDQDILTERQPAPYGRDFSLSMKEVHPVDRGVTVPWLVQAFGMPRARVVRLLEGCQPIGVARGGHQKVYDLREAAACLVKPKVNIKKYLAELDPKDLPENLKKEYWSARQTEQKVRMIAGDLWRSEDVLTVVGEIFKRIKDKSLLWVDTVEATHGITDEQRHTFIGLKNALLEEIDATVRALASGQMTPSQLAEFDDDEDEIQA